MPSRMIVAVIKVCPGGPPNDLGKQVGVTNEYRQFNKPTNHMVRYATYVADASIASIGSAIEGEFASVKQSSP